MRTTASVSLLELKAIAPMALASWCFFQTGWRSNGQRKNWSRVGCRDARRLPTSRKSSSRRASCFHAAMSWHGETHSLIRAGRVAGANSFHGATSWASISGTHGRNSTARWRAAIASTTTASSRRWLWVSIFATNTMDRTAWATRHIRRYPPPRWALKPPRRPTRIGRRSSRSGWWSWISTRNSLGRKWNRHSRRSWRPAKRVRRVRRQFRSRMALGASHVPMPEMWDAPKAFEANPLCTIIPRRAARIRSHHAGQRRIGCGKFAPQGSGNGRRISASRIVHAGDCGIDRWHPNSENVAGKHRGRESLRSRAWLPIRSIAATVIPSIASVTAGSRCNTSASPTRMKNHWRQTNSRYRWNWIGECRRRRNS